MASDVCLLGGERGARLRGDEVKENKELESLLINPGSFKCCEEMELTPRRLTKITQTKRAIRTGKGIDHTHAQILSGISRRVATAMVKLE